MASTTAENARPPKASPLGLPSEVRMPIYHCLFEDPRIRIHFTTWVDSITAMLYSGRNALRNIELEKFLLSMTQTCRLLRIESYPVLHKATTLDLCSAFECCLVDPDPREYLLSCAAGALHHIRKLSVDWYLLKDAPLHSLNRLEVLKVTQVRCEPETFTIEEVLAFTNEEAVQAIKKFNERTYICWLATPLGRNFRDYQMLCEGLIVEDYDDFEGPGPSLYILFDMDSHVVLSRKVIPAQVIEYGCQRCLDE